MSWFCPMNIFKVVAKSDMPFNHRPLRGALSRSLTVLVGSRDLLTCKAEIRTFIGERDGSVVECSTHDRGGGGGGGGGVKPHRGHCVVSLSKTH